MSKLTVTCVFVRGHVPFTAEYVVRLQSMAQRLLPSHRFVCLTDQASSLPQTIDTIEVRPPKGVYAWWTKLQLFNPELPLKGRCLYFDLDVLLLRDLRDIAEFPAEFALAPDGAPNFQPKATKLKVVKRFNSSVMAWDAGARPELFTDWRLTDAARLWGDQDWIGERARDAAAMPLDWFPRLSECGPPPWPSPAKVLLCKKPKNLDAAVKWPWFNEAWQ